MQLVTLLASNRYSITNTPQIFKGDTALSAFRKIYQSLANTVIHITSKTLLFARQLNQATLCRARAFLLQLTTQTTVTMTHIQQMLSTVNIAITVYCNTLYAQIDTQETFNINGAIFGNFARCRQIEIAAIQNQIAFAVLKLKQMQLRFACGKRNALASAQTPDRHAALIQFIAQDTTIVGNCTMFAKRVRVLFVQLVTVHHFANATNCHLSRQIKLLTDCIVGQVVNRHTPKRFCLPRLFTDKVASGIGTFKRLEKYLPLFGGRQEFDYRSQFHEQSLAQICHNVNMLKGVKALSLPMPKGRGISRRF